MDVSADQTYPAAALESPHCYWCCGARARDVICTLVLFAFSCRKHIYKGPESSWREGPEILSGLHERGQDWGARSETITGSDPRRTPSTRSSFTSLEPIVCIPLTVCLNTDSDWGMGSDWTLGQRQLPGSAACCVGQLSHLAFFQRVCQHRLQKLQQQHYPGEVVRVVTCRRSN